MTAHYCLTVEVKSKAIKDGLGYMVAFSLPDDKLQPAQMAEFANWHEDVKNAVLRAGDQVFAADPYTRKLAIAELMNELSNLNGAYSIQIGGGKNLPAVQVQSSNPFDHRIDIDFTDKDGHFTVTEHSPDHFTPASVKISGHGHTGLVEGGRDFPFTQKPVPPAARKPGQVHHPKP